MKFLSLISILFFLVNCSKPKTVLICGDHVCINKKEAKQFFEENLSLEVKIIDSKIKESVDLVELNLRENKKGERRIQISSKKNTKKEVKALSNDQINKIKENIKKKQKQKKMAKKTINMSQSKPKFKKKESIIINDKNPIQKKNIKTKLNREKREVEDVCSVIKECNIEEISKFLLKKGMKKNFPDITKRQ